VDSLESALKRISAGDIFHASAPNGASMICLASEVTESIIHAKTVTSQFVFEFDRTTGVADWEYEGRRVRCVIDSVAPLPPEVHALMLELKEKYSTPSEDGRLTVDQKRALLFVSRFYPENPLAMPWETMSTGRIAKAVGDDLEDHELTLKEFQDRLLAAFMIPGPRPSSESA
jgi:hypothetical protein